MSKTFHNDKDIPVFVIQRTSPNGEKILFTGFFAQGVKTYPNMQFALTEAARARKRAARSGFSFVVKKLDPGEMWEA